MFKNIKIKAVLPPLLLFLFTFAIYVHNLSASVYGGDSGDFLSAIAVKGVPHPSGYPLYTLLGIITSWLPMQQTLAWKVGLLSAFFSSLAVVVMYKIMYELTKSTLLASVTALTLAFVFPFWLFAEVSEVFALHSFFLLLLFYLGLLVYTIKRTAYLYLLSFFTGLSFSNHDLTLLILPTLFIFVFAARKKIALSAKVALKCLGLVILGLLPYLYIPIAASLNPPVNWDQASTLENFIYLVTRTSYGWNGGNGVIWAVRMLSFQHYISYIVSALSIFLFGFALFGIFALLLRRQFTILYAILFAYLLFGPLFTIYNANIPNILSDNFYQGIAEKFYTSSILFLLLLVPFGVLYICEFLVRMLSGFLSDAKSLPLLEKIFLSLFLLAPLWLFFSNISKTDLHTIFVGDVLGRDVLTTLPKNSYVVIGSDDNFVFNSWYMQYAYGVRKDVAFSTRVDFSQIVLTNDPAKQGKLLLTSGSKKENSGTKKFLFSLPKDIANTPFGRNITTALVNGRVFILIPDYNGLNATEKTAVIPFGLLFQRVYTKEQVSLSRDDYLKIQQPILASLEKSAHAVPSSESLSQLKLIADIPVWYARALANTAFYLIAKYNDYEKAREYFRIALSIDPNNTLAYEGLGDYSLYKKNCQKAKDAYEKTTDIDFLNTRVYRKLYNVISGCLHDTAKAQQLRDFFSQYPSIFGNITSSN